MSDIPNLARDPWQDADKLKQATAKADDAAYMRRLLDLALTENTAQYAGKTTPDWLRRTWVPNLDGTISPLDEYNKLLNKPDIQKLRTAAQLEETIAKAAAALYAPMNAPYSVLPAAAPNLLSRVLSFLSSPLFLGADLLTTSPDLNSNEDSELVARRRMSPTITK